MMLDVSSLKKIKRRRRVGGRVVLKKRKAHLLAESILCKAMHRHTHRNTLLLRSYKSYMHRKTRE